MEQSKIEKADKKACKLIDRELSIKMDTLFLTLEADSDSYADDLKCFKLLFNSLDKDYRLALWNGLFFLKNICEKDFTREELSFIEKCKEVKRKHIFPEFININAQLQTKRLILRPTNGERDKKLYYRHLKEDGDFDFFTGLKWSRKNMSYYILDRPFFFVIVEKNSGKMIGYTGLVWSDKYNKKSEIVKIEYYIFKQYRNNGYAKEAVCAITNAALNCKFCELKETNYSGIFRKKRAKIGLIRAIIRSDNEASLKLIESCGYTHSGTLHREFMVEGKGFVDEEIYEIWKEEKND